MKFAHRLFTVRGRLARGAFFARVLIILIAFSALSEMLAPLIGDKAVWLLNPLALWALLAASARRMHDRGFSGAWLLVGLVPVAGGVWLLSQLSSKGQASDGRWGPDPLRDRGEFLVVREP
jgi:uncharacterized membrane protein YhaH (DUF805 family)